MGPQVSWRPDPCCQQHGPLTTATLHPPSAASSPPPNGNEAENQAGSGQTLSHY
jgi:hypothetical protein